MTRSINSLLWSTTMRNFDPNEKLVYIYLLTNENTNAAGVYQISLRRIAEEVGLQPYTVDLVIQRLVEAGLIASVDGYIIIKDWARLQGLSGSKHEAAAKKVLDRLPDYVLAEYRSLYGIGDDATDEQPQESDTQPDRVSDRVSARERERENERESSKEKDKEEEKENIYNTPYGVEAAVPAPRAEAAGTDDKQLFKRLFASFLAVSPSMANRNKEAACVKTLIRYAKGSEALIRETLEYFICLRNTDRYWSKKPMLPSVLVYYWDHVRALIDEDKAKHNYDWLEALDKQQDDSCSAYTNFRANTALSSFLDGKRTAWFSLKTA